MVERGRCSRKDCGVDMRSEDNVVVVTVRSGRNGGPVRTIAGRKLITRTEHWEMMHIFPVRPSRAC